VLHFLCYLFWEITSKWLQIAFILLFIAISIKEKWIKQYPLSIGFILGGALGNLYDRFTTEAVVDYVYWHCGFDFAVFNLADVMIDFGVVLIILQEFIKNRKTKGQN